MVGFLNTYFEPLQFIEIIYIANKCNQYVICLSFIPFVRLFMRNIQTAVSPHPLKNWTHAYMNLFTRNSSYYHLLKYLLFLLEHPVYIWIVHCNRLFHVIELYGLWVSDYGYQNDMSPFRAQYSEKRRHIQIVMKCYKWYWFEYGSICTDIHITNFFFVYACSYQFLDQRY